MAARCLNGKEREIYVLQGDIAKFFQSISWDILLGFIAKTIPCPKTLALIEKIVTTHQTANGEDKQLSLFSSKKFAKQTVSVKDRKGLPIGNLTSQLFANVYLNELDHFVKETLKERWYSRYMDDFMIIHPDKNHLKAVKEKIREFLKEKLDLNLHPKKATLKNVKDGVPFVGYRIFYDHILVRGSTLKRMQRKYRHKVKLVKKGILTKEKLRQTENSLKGHLKHANAYWLSQMMFAQKHLTLVSKNSIN